MIRSLLFVAVLTLTFTASAQAQMSVLNEYYGRGVHAFNGGDLIKAYDFLSKAIDGGINDPRAYYFRGLTSIASGREFEADGDFQLGAQLEAKGGFGPAIGVALSRIQGANRLKLEDARREARLAFQSTARARSQARYGEMEAASGDVLREPPRPKATATQPAPPAIPPAADAPFAADAPAGTPKVESNDALEGTLTDPFADDAAPAAGAAGGAPAPAADPFNAPAADAGADPFGAPAADAPAADDAGADPFAF